jgi:5-(carboxyamino)imidazole ribonucleotide synthase
MTGTVRTIGVIGGGQLGRMLALAGIPMGLRFVFLDPASDACAAETGRHIVADYTDPAALSELASSCDVVTCEFENVPASALHWLSERVPVRPGPASFESAQDRIAERQAFMAADVPVAPHASVGSLDELHDAIARVGTPGVLKCTRGGYDGKGQARIDHPDAAELAWDSVGKRPCLYEQRIAFTREISIVGVRSAAGEFVAYPLTENTHHNGILHRSRVPASEGRPSTGLQGKAERRVRMLMDALGHVGVLTVEFFVIDDLHDTGQSQLIANEFAPRVHNSGHWTIEGAATSQFANHLRAIVGWPLGDTSAIGPVAMLNCIGAMPDAATALAIRGLTLHDYAKPPRDGRKVGHLTVRASSPEELEQRLLEAQRCLARPTC